MTLFPDHLVMRCAHLARGVSGVAGQLRYAVNRPSFLLHPGGMLTLALLALAIHCGLPGLDRDDVAQVFAHLARPWGSDSAELQQDGRHSESETALLGATCNLLSSGRWFEHRAWPAHAGVAANDNAAPVARLTTPWPVTSEVLPGRGGLIHDADGHASHFAVHHPHFGSLRVALPEFQTDKLGPQPAAPAPQLEPLTPSYQGQSLSCVALYLAALLGAAGVWRWRRSRIHAPAVASAVPPNVHGTAAVPAAPRVESLVAVARIGEQARVARDIHDELGVLQMAVRIEVKVSDKSQASSRQSVLQLWESVQGHIDSAMATAAHIADVTCCGVFTRMSLQAGIDFWAREFEAITRIPCSVAVAADDLPVNDEVVTNILTIVQEALINVARRDGTSRVKIVVGVDYGVLQVAIADDGTRVASAQDLDAYQAGVKRMIGRAQVLGGNLRIRDEPGHGVTVALRMDARIRT